MRNAPWPGNSISNVADFGYDERPARSRAAFLAESSRLADRLAKRLRGVDVLHTHNVGLGKHPRLTYAVKLARGAHDPSRSSIKSTIFLRTIGRRNCTALRHCTGKLDDAFWRAMCYLRRAKRGLGDADHARCGEACGARGSIRKDPRPSESGG
jgi:hypothetical protein